MRYKLLGRSGLRVSEICLGTMTFGTEFKWGSTKEDSRKVFDGFIEAGGNFFDTANHYTKGTSERLLGEFMGSQRDRFVVATKYSLSQNPQDPNASGNHRKSMHQALDASLKRLGTDYIDLYWIHAWDFMTPIEEVLRALDDTVRSGKILYIGISNTPAWLIAQANTIAELKGWTSFIGLQLQYSLIERTIEREFIQLAKAFDLSICAWSPLGMGVLTGKYLKQTNPQSRFDINKQWGMQFLTNSNRKIAQTVVDIANELGRSPSEVALNWLIHRPGRIIPIVGAKTLAQLKDNLGSLDFKLNDNQRARLDEVSAISQGFPHDFLKQEDVHKLLFGELFSQIDNHRSLG